MIFLPLALVLGAFVFAPAGEGQLLSRLILEFRRAEMADERANVLRKIAAIPDTSAPSDEVVDAIAKGLEDDSIAVRACAIQLLEERPASEHVLAAALASAKGLKVIWDRVLDIEPVLTPEYVRGRSPAEDRAEYERALREQQDERTRANQLAYYANTTVTIIRMYRDDRCVASLGAAIDAAPFEEHALQAMDGLFELGTGAAVARAIDGLAAMDHFEQDRARSRKRLARTRVERTPKDWKGTKDGWVAREERRIERMLVAFDAATARVLQRRPRYVERLRQRARILDESSLPVGSDHREWSRWLRLHKRKLPEVVD